MNQNEAENPPSIPCSIPYETLSHIHWSDFLDSNISSVHLDNQLINKTTNASPQPKVKINVDQHSLQCNEELDDTTASVQDKMAKYAPQSDSLAKTNAVQAIPTSKLPQSSKMINLPIKNQRKLKMITMI